jgi:3-hydroxyisobutyrate dehydrogenase
MSKKIAFIGLGVMGFPMAGHLAKAGYQMTVFNRTRFKADKWIETFGGNFAETPKQAAENAEIIFACVGNDQDLEQVAIGEHGAFYGMAKNTIFVDHTTASAHVERKLFEIAKQRGFHVLDAPVSGGQIGAENGVLTIMIGGEENAFQIAEPIMQCYAKKVKHFGKIGNGQLTKMVNQICVVGLIQGLAEGLHFAKAAGLDTNAVIETISKGAAQSWQMDNRAQTMIEGKFDFGFAVDWARKDLGIVLEEARTNGAHLPITALIDQFYSEVQAMGGNRWDTSSLITRLESRRIHK